MKNTESKFTVEKLVRWIGDDPKSPFREATLVSEVPVKATTLARIKSGSYKPSELMQNQFLNVMDRHKH